MRAEQRSNGVLRGARVVMVLGVLLGLVAAAMPAGAAPAPLYARPTGHVIPVDLRPFWESLGGANGLGWPIDEAKPTQFGVEQWFQYGRAYRNKGGDPLLATVGRESAQFRSVISNAAFLPKGQPTPGAKLANMEYVQKYGHYVGNGFLAVWTAKKAVLGAPISEEFTEGDTTVQYFESGRIELDAAANNTARLSMIGIQMHGPAAPAIEPPAAVEFLGDAPVKDIQGVKPHEGHWILVNLKDQRLYAYDGTKLVRDLAVSTGLGDSPTPAGTYTIQQRYFTQRMTGPGYDLPDVPRVQYFGNDNLSWQEGYSFHGAYWHHNWGNPMSHGCVNLPLDFSEWLWDWAGLGTVAEIIEG